MFTRESRRANEYSNEGRRGGMKDGGWRGRSGRQSRWREDGCGGKGLRDGGRDDRLRVE